MDGQIVAVPEPRFVCAGCGAIIAMPDWPAHFRDHSPEARERIERAERDRQSGVAGARRIQP